MSFNPFSSNPKAPWDYEDFLEQAVSLFEEGDLPEALKSFEKSIQLNSHPDENPNAYIGRGSVLMDLERFEEAIKSFDVIIEDGILPASYSAHLYKGETLMLMNQWQEAEVILTRNISAIERPPSFPDQLHEPLTLSYYDRALCRMNQSKFHDAVQDYTRAIQLNGGNIDYYASRCVAHFKNGDRVSAQKDFDFVRRNAPQHPILSDMAEELESENAFDIWQAARANNIDLQKPISKYPDSPEKLEAVKQLLEERQYDAAALLLETMPSPNAAKLLHKTKQFILARTQQSGTFGVLEEWIIENYRLFSPHHDLMRDARTYLFSKSLDRNFIQTVVNKLKAIDDPENTLNNTNFSRIYLDGADIASTDVVNSNFSMSSLQKVNFQNSNLMGTDFSGANLEMANLSGSDCKNADFSRANLRGADFSGANLREAIMFGAYIADAKFNTNTKLPDGTMWTPYTDLKKFACLDLNSSTKSQITK